MNSDNMNQKSFIIAALLAATVLSVIVTPMAFADESETSTDQKLKQKNVGSDNVKQNNCAEQLIEAGADNNCRHIN